MNLADIRKVIDLLIENNMSTKYLCAEHDIVYLPVTDEDHRLAPQLKALGCIWEDHSWAFYT